MQCFVFRNYFNNDIITSFQPNGADAKDYVTKAELLFRTHNFVEAFKDGWRLPGYPMVVLFCYWLSDLIHIAPLAILRVLHVVASGFIPLFLYKAQLNFSNSKMAAWSACIFSAIYIPFYYFSPQILAESFSLLIISATFWQMSLMNQYRKETSLRLISLLAVFITILTYFKPNLILLTFPVLVFIMYTYRDELFKAIRYCFFFSIIVLALLLPWVWFVSSQNHMFIPLATTSGCDMVIGVGVPLNSDGSDKNSLVYKFEQKHNLPADITQIAEKESKPFAVQNAEYQSEAIKIWKQRPLLTLRYGIMKILHGFGFSLRGLKDYMSLSVFLLSLMGFIWQIRKKQNTYLCLLFASVTLLYAIQTIVYIPDMRMRIILFDIPAVFLISVLMAEIIQKNKHQSSY